MQPQLVLNEIRAEMARQRVSQRELAGKIGRAQEWVSRRLTGNVSLTLEELVQITDALGIPAARLLADEPV